MTYRSTSLQFTSLGGERGMRKDRRRESIIFAICRGKSGDNTNSFGAFAPAVAIATIMAAWNGMQQPALRRHQPHHTCGRLIISSESI